LLAFEVVDSSSEYQFTKLSEPSTRPDSEPVSVFDGRECALGDPPLCSDGYFINVGRGLLVNQDALITALDVFEGGTTL